MVKTHVSTVGIVTNAVNSGIVRLKDIVKYTESLGLSKDQTINACNNCLSFRYIERDTSKLYADSYRITNLGKDYLQNRYGKYQLIDPSLKRGSYTHQVLKIIDNLGSPASRDDIEKIYSHGNFSSIFGNTMYKGYIDINDGIVSLTEKGKQRLYILDTHLNGESINQYDYTNFIPEIKSKQTFQTKLSMIEQQTNRSFEKEPIVSMVADVSTSSNILPQDMVESLTSMGKLKSIILYNFE